MLFPWELVDQNTTESGFDNHCQVHMTIPFIKSMSDVVVLMA